MALAAEAVTSGLSPGAKTASAGWSDETGGEAFFLGYENLPSFKGYLDQLQAILDNQYWLGFEMKPGKKGKLRSVEIDTEISGIDISSANGVYVPAAR